MNPTLILSLIRRHPWTSVFITYSMVVTTFWCLNWPGSRPGQADYRAKTADPAAHGKASPAMGAAEDGAAARDSNRTVTERSVTIDWRSMESEDFQTYVTKLRSTGCPERTIRRIISAEVKESFDQDRIALLEEEKIPFWNAGYGSSEENSQDFQDITSKEAAFLASLLGPSDTSTESDLQNCRMPATLRFGPGLEAKRQATLAIMTQAESNRERVADSIGEDGPTPAQEAEFRRIEATKKEAMETLFTDREREDFEIRNSPLADDIRVALKSAGREVTEDKFREMFRNRKTLAERTETAAVSGEDLRDAWGHYHEAIDSAMAGDNQP